MLSSIIIDSEKLYRGVIRNPDFWIEGENFPSSAIFKDSKGVSVDRDGMRNEEEVCNAMFTKKDFRAIARIKGEDCTEADVFAKSIPLADNEFHAEIHDSQTKIKITSRIKLNRLMKGVKILER